MPVIASSLVPMAAAADAAGMLEAVANNADREAASETEDKL